MQKGEKDFKDMSKAIWILTLFLGLLMSELYIFIEKVFVIDVYKEYGWQQACIIDAVSIIFTYYISAKITLYSGIENNLNFLIKRSDFTLCYFVGFLISQYQKGFLVCLYEKVHISPNAAILSAIGIMVYILMDYCSKERSTDVRTGFLDESWTKSKGFFIQDAELISSKKDLLNYTDRAIHFAERVYNNGSIDSVVFGVDSPWGAGKSSFMNLCIEHWKNVYAEKIMLYRFTPLRFEQSADLQIKLIDGLIETIQKSEFVPELNLISSKYAKHIRAKDGLSILGLKFNIPVLSKSIDEYFDALNFFLKNSKRKIIVIVDDLDRLPFEISEKILYTIKIIFPLSNMTYVLCYDTDNFYAHRLASNSVAEFMEKFVSIKICIPVDAEMISRYLTDSLSKTFEENLNLTPLFIDQIKNCVRSVSDICKTPDFYSYKPYIGNLRKIKRLLNTILLFDIHWVDFKIYDFEDLTLIHLILIYINYPSIFNLIYDAEKNSKISFRSLLIADDEVDSCNKDRKKSSLSKSEIRISDLDSGARFLLNKIYHFDDEKIFDGYEQSQMLKEKELQSKNIEIYLMLIVHQSKPVLESQKNFHYSKVAAFKAGTSLDAIFKEQAFEFNKDPQHRIYILDSLVNSRAELSMVQLQDLMDYFILHFKDFPLIYFDKSNYVGDRYGLIYSFTKLLNECGIKLDEQEISKSINSTIYLSDWIFGRRDFNNNGILQRLWGASHNVLNLYDIVAFRLTCCRSRGGDVRRIADALNLDNKNRSGDSESVLEINEMRFISQYIFQLFNKEYIESKKNLFEIIDNLTNNQLTGEYLRFYREPNEANSALMNDDKYGEAILQSKSQILHFTTFQLGNSSNELGVGCGFYALTGCSDNGAIRSVMSNYLIEICFNANCDKNILYFIDYCLFNSEYVFDFNQQQSYTLQSNLSLLTKVILIEDLKKYWLRNKVKIRQIALANFHRRVYAPKFVLPYKDNINKLFDILDAV